MDEAEFWTLIDRLDWSHEGDDDQVVAPVVQDLARRPRAEIEDFQNILADSLFAIDGRAWARESGYAGSSDDGFLYARCAVIANGRDTYPFLVEARLLEVTRA